MKYKWLYFLISSLILVPGIISLILFGLKPSIDFTGGTLIEIQNSNVPYRVNKTQSYNSKFKTILEQNGFSAGGIQSSGENSLLLRLNRLVRKKIKNY